MDAQNKTDSQKHLTSWLYSQHKLLWCSNKMPRISLKYLAKPWEFRWTPSDKMLTMLSVNPRSLQYLKFRSTHCLFNKELAFTTLELKSVVQVCLVTLRGFNFNTVMVRTEQDCRICVKKAMSLRMQSSVQPSLLSRSFPPICTMRWDGL